MVNRRINCLHLVYVHVAILTSTYCTKSIHFFRSSYNIQLMLWFELFLQEQSECKMESTREKQC